MGTSKAGAESRCAARTRGCRLEPEVGSRQVAEESSRLAVRPEDAPRTYLQEPERGQLEMVEDRWLLRGSIDCSSTRTPRHDGRPPSPRACASGSGARSVAAPSGCSRQRLAPSRAWSSRRSRNRRASRPCTRDTLHAAGGAPRDRPSPAWRCRGPPHRADWRPTTSTPCRPLSASPTTVKSPDRSSAILSRSRRSGVSSTTTTSRGLDLDDLADHQEPGPGLRFTGYADPANLRGTSTEVQ